MIDWEILYKIPLGLYVLGADDGKSPAGAVIDAVMVASNQPCTLAISCGNNGYTKQTIDKSLCFSLSDLPKNISREPMENVILATLKKLLVWNIVIVTKGSVTRTVKNGLTKNTTARPIHIVCINAQMTDL